MLYITYGPMLDVNQFIVQVYLKTAYLTRLALDFSSLYKDKNLKSDFCPWFQFTESLLFLFKFIFDTIKSARRKKDEPTNYLFK